MEKEKNIDQTTQEAPIIEIPVAEVASAPKQRRKRRTKAEIEADAKKAAGKAKHAAKKAANAAKKAGSDALDTIANAAKPAVKKGTQAAEKTAKPRVPAPAVIVQYSGADIETSALTDAAVAEFRAVKKRAGIKDIKLYIKPEEHAAYYVINGDFTGKVDF